MLVGRLASRDQRTGGPLVARVLLVPDVSVDSVGDRPVGAARQSRDPICETMAT